MCETCGCGNSEGFIIHDLNHDHHEHGEHPHNHDHPNDQGHSHSHSHLESHGDGHSRTMVIDMNLDILAGNNITAGMNRRFFEGRKVFCMNMVSSPGSGKTTILEKTINHFSRRANIYVIEGDQQTLLDSERIKRAGARAIQVNTGSGCHLDAQMVESALAKMHIEANSVLFIENVGNLVCPALFDLGESKRIVVMSVTEGEDKPLKYPNIFQTSQLCIINKSDLLPYVDFSTDTFIKNARKVNPGLDILTVSAMSGEGMEKWYEWIPEQSGFALTAG